MNRYQMEAERVLDLQEGGGNVPHIGQIAMHFQNAINVISDEARRTGRDREWINMHPILKLYIELLYELNRMDGEVTLSRDEYEKAVEAVREIARGSDCPVK